MCVCGGGGRLYTPSECSYVCTYVLYWSFCSNFCRGGTTGCLLKGLKLSVCDILYVRFSSCGYGALSSQSVGFFILHVGTHDILNATTTETGDDAIVITTLYSEHSDARGALFDFVFIDDNGDVDFTRSVLLALDRNTSLHHTLPFNLYPGQYRVFVYDIESDGTLSNGVGYPAVTNELIASENSQGNILKLQYGGSRQSVLVFA